MIKKHFKKLVSVALSAVMVMGMSVTAFAAENQTSTDLQSRLGVFPVQYRWRNYLL